MSLDRSSTLCSIYERQVGKAEAKGERKELKRGAREAEAAQVLI